MKKQKELFVEWLKIRGTPKSSFTLCGHLSRKTALVNAVANEFNHNVIEMNAKGYKIRKSDKFICKPATSYTALDNFTKTKETKGNVLF